MSKVHMMAIYRVKAGKLDDVKKSVAEFVKQVREKEPGTLFYEAYQGRGDVTFFHLMTFEDAYSEEKHRATPHMAEFVAQLYPNCEEEPGFVELDLVASNVR